MLGSVIGGVLWAEDDGLHRDLIGVFRVIWGNGEDGGVGDSSFGKGGIGMDGGVGFVVGCMLYVVGGRCWVSQCVALGGMGVLVNLGCLGSELEGAGNDDKGGKACSTVDGPATGI